MVVLVIADCDGMASCELVLATRKEIIVVIIMINDVIFGSFIENMRN